ncbi:MAG: glycine dehydrogenase (aminomethyl-transferring), partial [Proteobacteria bacterium]|nr:glycine dehydrogenase (aminomethyl-transferring) [Pseudomonadota bacterium]
MPNLDLKLKDLDVYNDFIRRHIGPGPVDESAMLTELGMKSLDELVDKVVPASIQRKKPLAVKTSRSERQVLDQLYLISTRNQLYKSFIGMGYYDCITPPVVLRNVLESPGWYTAYTPYQPEISQGRLEALLNFQTMIVELTGMELANASMLDEATAAAEAMTLCRRVCKGKGEAFFVAADCHPQTIAIVRTRARPLGIE